jgi:type 1 glutamine amidotransferase
MPAELQEEWAKWRPDFSQYDVVVSNYNGVLWPDSVREAFERFVRDGGGFVSIHAADNAFAQWDEYNRMIGVGGWYGRDESSGPKIYWENGQLVQDTAKGRAGAHGKRGDILVVNRAPEHPITKGMPSAWMHPADEVYYNMRGPAENIEVLATAMSDTNTGGSGKHQPILMAISYGKGRVFHEMLGHDEKAFAGVGFQYTLMRGTEWAATGEVTFPEVGSDELPDDRVAVRDPQEIRPPVQDNEEGFVSLFNGRNLDGWTPAKENPESFSVHDGQLVVKGPRSHLFYTGDVHGGQFKDFELKLQAKTMPNANSGVYFHTKYQDEGWPNAGYECQVNATHGDPKKTGSLYGVVNVVVLKDGQPEPRGGENIIRDAPPNKDGQWFDYHIIVKDRVITLKVNGETTVQYTEPEGGPRSNFGGRKLSQGTFAIQAHDPGSEIHFRNIRVKVLD